MGAKQFGEVDVDKDKDKTIQSETVTEKSNSIPIPTRQTKLTERSRNVNYSEPINESTSTFISKVTSPVNSTSTYSQNESPFTTESDLNKWKTIFVESSLFRGICLEKKELEYSERYLFEFHDFNKIHEFVRVKDESYSRTYLKDKDIQSYFVSSDFFDVGLETFCPSIGIGINIEYLKSKSTTNTERTLYKTYCENYPRFEVIINSSYLKPTSNFIQEIDTVIGLVSPDKQIDKLKEIYRKYGHVYPGKVVLGGHLYYREIHIVKNKAEEDNFRLSLGASGNTSLIKPINAFGEGGTEDNSRRRSLRQTSDIIWKTVGGESLKFNIHDIKPWKESVADRFKWRVIEQDNFQSIITLLDPTRKEKIEKIEKCYEKKKYLERNYSKWEQQGSTVAGGSKGKRLEQLDLPFSICVDDDKTIYIADCGNQRIIEWKSNAFNGRIVAGGNGKGNKTNQLNEPTDVIIDKENNSLIIADNGNRRVVRWSRQNQIENGEVIIENIGCYGLTMDKNGSIYVSDYKKNEVKQWRKGEINGRVVAGGNGKGCQFNQLNSPTYISVDEDCSLYITDKGNDRVMKWEKDAEEGEIIAGGNSQGNSLNQLFNPAGVIVDPLGRIYVADGNNNRVMCWCKGGREGRIVVGANGRGKQPNQFFGPTGLSFDNEGSLYVSDFMNCRIQNFVVDFS